jgi:hypothetical protein
MVFIDLKVDFEYTMMQENAKCFDKVQDATVVCLRTKDFVGIIFSLV